MYWLDEPVRDDSGWHEKLTELVVGRIVCFRQEEHTLWSTMWRRRLQQLNIANKGGIVVVYLCDVVRTSLDMCTVWQGGLRRATKQLRGSCKPYVFTFDILEERKRNFSTLIVHFQATIVFPVQFYACIINQKCLKQHSRIQLYFSKLNKTSSKISRYLYSSPLRK